MINYIQQLLPRLRGFSSQLDKKELFVDKLFTLLQPNKEVHQYTFNRDGRLFLAINGKTIEGSWELLRMRMVIFTMVISIQCLIIIICIAKRLEMLKK